MASRLTRPRPAPRTVAKVASMLRERRAWLIAYDVRDPRRLVRVHRRMLRHATPLEYSVFWLTGTQMDRLRCLQDVLPLLREDADDLRMYMLPARGLRLRLGAPALPAGIQWSALPAEFLDDIDAVWLSDTDERRWDD